jgi:ATP-dependent Clp protease protease subunit
MNKIQLFGEINSEMLSLFDSELSELEAAQASKITIVLNSEGGDATDALAICARMRLSRNAFNTNFTVTVLGYCASAATLILAYGDKRLMACEAWCMVHEEADHKVSGNVTHYEHHAHNMRLQERQWNKLFAARTKVSEAEWEQINKRDTYLTPEQCLEMGLIDAII